MFKRTIVGGLLAFFIYSVIAYLSTFEFFILTAAGIMLAQLEFYRFHFNKNTHPLVMVGILFGLLVSTGFYFRVVFSEKELICNIIIGMLIFITFYGGRIETSLVDVSIVFFGIFYISWLMSHLILVRDLLNGKSLLFFLFLVTYSSDTGAYFTGKSFGGPKLCPNISPNKTWAGAVGGLFASISMAVIANKILGGPFLLTDVLRLGLILGVIGPIGDLAESVLKRSSGVKDSGSIIPGHGGVLDRIDSLIFTAPIYYYYVFFLIVNKNETLIAV